MGRYDYKRRPTTEVKVGGTPLGGSNPVRIQSMANTSTMDTAGSVAQTARMVAAGAEYVRFTAQGEREARNLAEIKAALRREGIDVPLVADIHFNPRAAFEAARHVEKVRINPGNFVDPARTFRKLDDSDEAFALGLRKIEEKLVPFLELCRSHGTAIRIGVNHGSLSDRIMSRYGDTPEGMVHSAMEFLRICRAHDFNDVVISVKASNVRVMIETVRRLVRAMDGEDMHYPLHLGVTEAGDGEDGRVKSAVGIGTLLAEGIGDTIRVSLSEDPEAELPVARALTDYISLAADAAPIPEPAGAAADRGVMPERRRSRVVAGIGGERQPVVVAETSAGEYLPDFMPDVALDSAETDFELMDASEILAGKLPRKESVVVLTSLHANARGEMRAALAALDASGADNPVILRRDYSGISADEARLRAAVDLGSLIIDGYSDGIMIGGDALSRADAARTAFGILQSARLRFTHTEYISCPSCGRTMFDLQATLAAVKAATSRLKGLKIGVMGCIVNGPGEMADADYGYVGACAGHVSLYKGKECVEKNIPEAEAVEHLVDLIKRNGDWK